MILCKDVHALLHVISLVDWPKHVKFFYMTHLVLCLTRTPNITRRQTKTPAWSVRHRKTACRCSQNFRTSDGSKEKLLEHLSSLSTAGLKEYIDKNGDNLNLSFFEWLASR